MGMVRGLMSATTTKTSQRFIVRGVSDDADFCMCCGRTGLKRVVWIEDTETQEVRHFGTTCAAAPVKGFPKDEIKKAIANFETLEAMTWKSVHREIRALGLRSGTYNAVTNEIENTPAETIAKRKELYPVMRARILAINPHLSA